jgi:amidase
VQRPVRVHAFCNDALGFHDAVALSELLRNRQVSPTELVEAAIARAELVEPHLNAIQVATYSQAKELAAQFQNTLPQADFACIPSFIKDNTDIADLPTQHGSRAIPAVPVKKDGDFAKQYKSLGVILLGKTRLPEFGFNCSTEFEFDPPTRNPWNTRYSCGGSSGGSAALVAAGVVPIAHANDGGGSTRIPAACCGLVGLKPTRGRTVLDRKLKSLPVKVVSESLVSRSVRDTAYFMAGAEQYWKNRRLPEIGLVEGPSPRRLRVGLMLRGLAGQLPCEQTIEAVESVARLLEFEGHTVRSIEPPAYKNFGEDFACYWAFLAFVTSKFGKSTFNKQFDASKLDGFSRGLAGLFVDYWYRVPRALIRLNRSWKQCALTMREFDVILSPVLGHVTAQLGQFSPDVPFETMLERLRGYASYTPLNNANGSPAISLPVGLSREGLPIGLQFAARHGDERTLLELAYEFEQLRPWPSLQSQLALPDSQASSLH